MRPVDRPAPLHYAGSFALVKVVRAMGAWLLLRLR